MNSGRCGHCGTTNNPSAAFCRGCGRQLAVQKPPLTLGRYTPLRIQIDPLEPPPLRDARWVFFVLGICLAIVGGILLITDAIVSSATSIASGSSGGGPSSPGGDNAIFVYVFLVPGLTLLGIGSVLATVAFLHIVKGPVRL